MSGEALELATRARVDVVALERALGRQATPRARELCARLWTSIEAMARAIEERPAPREAAPREAAPREAAPAPARETLAMLRVVRAAVPGPVKRPTGGRPNPCALHREPERRRTNSRDWNRARVEEGEP